MEPMPEGRNPSHRRSRPQASPRSENWLSDDPCRCKIGGAAAHGRMSHGRSDTLPRHKHSNGFFALVLSGGQSYTFSIVFRPASGPSSSGSVAIVSDAVNSTLTVALSGSGSAAGLVTASPSSLGFGNVLVGSSKSLSMSLAASSAPVTITGASSTSSEFTITGISFPVTIAAGQSKAFNAVFTAQASGTTSATLQFTSNAANSPIAENVSGTGTSGSTHNVTLSWKSGSSGTSGYNVYRSTASGGPYSKVNPVLDPSSTYVDSSVSGGKTYYYVTTAVSSSGTESKFSNQATAAVPGP